MRHLDQGRLAADDTDQPRGKGPGALPRRGVSAQSPACLGGPPDSSLIARHVILSTLEEGH